MQSDSPPPEEVTEKNGLHDLVGRSLGQFRIIERIGVGGMATVFKAYQPTLDRYVAIKVLPAYHAQDPVFVERFVQEARSIARLAHPNIVHIHDFGEQDNITYIVMEYVDGGTLKDRLQRSVSFTEAADFIMQASEGLGAAHRQGIVHRDVKPANMLLRQNGHLLLSDFGIAKILEKTTGLTRAGVGIGTPQYISPEQGTGQTVDVRSDIYCLGIVFFQCLTGRVPFMADSPIAMTIKHVSEALPVEYLHTAGVPAPIEYVVVKMAAKSPQERYQSMDAVVEDLARALTDSHLSWSPWRSGSSSVIQQGDKVIADPRQQGIRACFRCGTENPNTRLFCTTCGYDLADTLAQSDRYLGPHGYPVLARLSFQNGYMTNRSFRFHQSVTTIGRTSGNDLIISGSTVSRHHARLWFADGKWCLEDLQSINGTFVNNVRIYHPMILQEGDSIRFGDETAVFYITT